MLPEPPAVAAKCPDCGAAREPADAAFCESCGFNFGTGAHGQPKPVASAWEVLVSVDPTLRTDESPEAPASFEPLRVRLTDGSNLIGRRSEKRAVFPQVPLDFDDAVSHRHALIELANGRVALRDVGSANGTKLNGADVEPLRDLALKDGDQITLGHWTRLTVRASAG
jgi:predicted component of type VI protein secretion system